MEASPKPRVVSLSSSPGSLITPGGTSSSLFRGLPYLREGVVAATSAGQIPSDVAYSTSSQNVSPASSQYITHTPGSMMVPGSPDGSTDDTASVMTASTKAPATPRDVVKATAALLHKHDSRDLHAIDVTHLNCLPLPPPPPQRHLVTGGTAMTMTSPSPPDAPLSPSGVSKMVQHARLQTSSKSWATPAHDVGSPSFSSASSVTQVDSAHPGGTTSQFSTTRPPSLAMQFFVAAQTPSSAHTASDKTPEAAWEDDSSALDAKSGTESASASTAHSRSESLARVSERAVQAERSSRQSHPYDAQGHHSPGHGEQHPGRYPDTSAPASSGTTSRSAKTRRSDRARELERLEMAAQELRAQMAAEEDERTPSDSESGSSADDNPVHRQLSQDHSVALEPVDADILALRQQILTLQHQQKGRRRQAHAALGQYTYDADETDGDMDDGSRVSHAHSMDTSVSRRQPRRFDTDSLQPESSRRRAQDRQFSQAPSVASSGRVRTQPDHGYHASASASASTSAYHNSAHGHGHKHAARSTKPQRRSQQQHGRQTPMTNYRHHEEPHGMRLSDSEDDAYPPISSRGNLTTSRNQRRRAGPMSPPRGNGDAKIQELSHKIEMLEQIIRGTPFGGAAAGNQFGGGPSSPHPAGPAAPQPGTRTSSARRQPSGQFPPQHQHQHQQHQHPTSPPILNDMPLPRSRFDRGDAHDHDDDDDDDDSDPDLTDDWGASRPPFLLHLDDHRPTPASRQGLPVVAPKASSAAAAAGNPTRFRRTSSVEDVGDRSRQRRSQPPPPPPPHAFGIRGSSSSAEASDRDGLRRGVAMKRSVSPAPTVASAFQFNATPALEPSREKGGGSSAGGGGGGGGGGGLRTLFGVVSNQHGSSTFLSNGGGGGGGGGGGVGGGGGGTASPARKHAVLPSFSAETRSIRSGDGVGKGSGSGGASASSTVLLSFSRKRTERVEIPKAKMKQAAGRGRVYITPVKE